MDEKQLQKILAVLSEKISSLESDLALRNYQIKTLKEENARLEELLNPTKKIGED